MGLTEQRVLAALAQLKAPANAETIRTHMLDRGARRPSPSQLRMSMMRLKEAGLALILWSPPDPKTGLRERLYALDRSRR